MSELTPGRELDALVAEKVMGLVLQPITVVDYKGVHTEPGSVVKDYTAPDGRKCRSVKECPHYSTSIADAWLVVEKLKYIEVDNISGVWSATAKHEDNLGYAESETAPHAICLAALKAVGYELVESTGCQ